MFHRQLAKNSPKHKSCGGQKIHLEVSTCKFASQILTVQMRQLPSTEHLLHARNLLSP
jgi:hypothetical protein